MTNWHTSWFKCTYRANGQMTTFKMWYDFVILCILKTEDYLTFDCYFHIFHLYKQTMNKTKYFVPLLLTFTNQKKSLFMYLKATTISAPYAATSSMPGQHLLVNGCWNTGVPLFSSSPDSLAGFRLSKSSFSGEDPSSFSGVNKELVLCDFPTWIFKPFSGLKVASQLSHLNIGLSGSRFSETYAVSSFLFFLSSFLSLSLLSWLGDFFFFSQELLASSLLSKVKASCAKDRLKLNLMLDSTSPWQKTRHFSTTTTSIFMYQGHITEVIPCWSNFCLNAGITYWQFKGSTST